MKKRISVSLKKNFLALNYVSIIYNFDQIFFKKLLFITYLRLNIVFFFSDFIGGIGSLSRGIIFYIFCILISLKNYYFQKKEYEDYNIIENSIIILFFIFYYTTIYKFKNYFIKVNNSSFKTSKFSKKILLKKKQILLPAVLVKLTFKKHALKLKDPLFIPYFNDVK